MRASLFKYSILLSLGLIAMLLSACALDSASADPVVTPDITVPSTLKVLVTVTEDQDASDGVYGSSDIKLTFETNEISETNTVIFTHGESIRCILNGRVGTMTLGNATDYSFHVDISANPTSYSCDYFYPGGSENIFSFTGPQNPLSPALVSPVGNIPNFKVRYIPGQTIPLSSTCTVQVTANAPNASVMGNSTSENGNIYTGPDVRGLSGSGNILMTRSCLPYNFDHHNAADDIGPHFDAVNVTYVSKASSEVTWIAPSTT